MVVYMDYMINTPEDIRDPILSDIADIVLKKRYLIKDEDGDPIESPRDMFWRVAKTIADEEVKYGVTEDQADTLARQFYDMMANGIWLPNSPTLMNAGRPLGQLSACFVLPIADCMTNDKDGIYDTLKDMAIIHKSGGGTGFSFSSLRPGGSTVRSTTGVASGPVSFMRLYDASTDVVKQGGTRRGANMGVLRVDHPDILNFIDCKQNTAHITNFNISVAITDEFMEAVDNDGSHYFIDPHTGKVTGSVPARDIWSRICQNAWRTGEPGLFFIDEANRHNPVSHLGDYEATNPCGEQPLLPYDVCNLGSLNLSKFVENGEFNYEEMEKYVCLSIRFLDNVIDANTFPLHEIEELAHNIRRIGNGVMGWADTLIKLGIPYGSAESIKLATDICGVFVDACISASEELAIARGSFPEWEDSAWGPDGYDMAQRNCNVTTIAPTGTISMIAGCSGGIEPIYAVAFQRNQADEIMTEVNADFVTALQVEGLDVDRIIATVTEEGTVDVPMVPQQIRNVFRTSSDVTPEQHVDMQAAWQRQICSAISKTINLPREATVDDVEMAYLRAYESECKGVTVYRDGSRDAQVLSTGKTQPILADQKEPESVGNFARPRMLDGRTHKIESPIGRMYITVNRDEYDNPVEVFIAVGKAGGTAGANSEAIGRLCSLALRNRIPMEDIYRQLRGISSERAIGIGQAKVLSAPDAVAQILANYMNGDAKVTNMSSDYAACPDCASALEFSEGCYTCHSCGYSGCG
jgi:ribonucleoside-diphosphate reductase alpha chain